MTTQLSKLPPYLREAEIYFIGRGDEDDLTTIKPVVIDGLKNTTGNDIALLFTTPDKARTYQAKYPSLARLDIYQATINELVAIFDGNIDHFTVDRV